MMKNYEMINAFFSFSPFSIRRSGNVFTHLRYACKYVFILFFLPAC
jgi:hypothetical protein